MRFPLEHRPGLEKRPRLTSLLLFMLITTVSACDGGEARPGQSDDCRNADQACVEGFSCAYRDSVYACFQRCILSTDCPVGLRCDGESRICVPASPADGGPDAGDPDDLCVNRGPSCCVLELEGRLSRGACYQGLCTDGAKMAPNPDCVAAEGTLVFDPSSVVFPVTAADDFPQQRRLIISHRGESAVTIEALDLSGWAGCDRVTAGLGPLDPLPQSLAHCRYLIDERPQLPAVLDNQSIVTITLGYIPGAPVPSATTLAIDTGSAAYSVPVSVSDAPRFAVNPTGLNITGEREEQLVVRNAGSGELIVRTLTLNLRGETPQGGPEIVATPAAALPWALGPEQFVRVGVRYSPSDDVPDVADLVFETNDPAQPAVTVTVRANP